MRYSIGSGSGVPLSRIGQRPPSALRQNFGAHQRQRIEHAAHRPLAQRGIAVEFGGDSMAADDAHHQPCAGAGIAEIERRRAAPAARRCRRHRPARRPRHAVRFARPAPGRPRRCGAHPPLPAGPRSRFARRVNSPRMKARCEMDLSPGGRSRPLSGPPGAALKAEDGGGTRVETAKIPPGPAKFAVRARNMRVGEKSWANSAPPRAAISVRRRPAVSCGRPVKFQLTGAFRLTNGSLKRANAAGTRVRLPGYGRGQDDRSLPRCSTILRGQTVAKPELGNKHTCQNCGTKFFDLNKTPVVCPKCGTVQQATTRTPARQWSKRTRKTADQGVEIVSLDEVEAAETASKPQRKTMSRSRTRAAMTTNLPRRRRRRQRRRHRPDRRRYRAGRRAVKHKSENASRFRTIQCAQVFAVTCFLYANRFALRSKTLLMAACGGSLLRLYSRSASAELALKSHPKI